MKKKAFELILIFGLISLFGDIIYEGGRSVNGPYLALLGASAAAIGFFAGAGEFLNYAFRMVSGYFADRIGTYWLFVIAGYAMLVAVPLMAAASTWQVAIAFIMIERLGKAVRGPARDTIVSMASKQVGTGLGFGIAEVMDQIGAVTGPLILSVLFFTQGPQKGVAEYRQGYSLFWIPLVLLMVCIAAARMRVPQPEVLEKASGETPSEKGFSRLFWLYAAFTFATTTGFANVILINYHFKTRAIFSDAAIPLLYALAMAVDAVAAIIIGKTYDIFKSRHNNQAGGLAVLVVMPVLTVVATTLAFSNFARPAIAGMVIWGVVMGCHETVMRSAIADITPLTRRGSGYGIFNAGYGLAMFAGSAVMGLLYGKSLAALIAAVIVVEAAAVVLFFMMRQEAFSHG